MELLLKICKIINNIIESNWIKNKEIILYHIKFHTFQIEV